MRREYDSDEWFTGREHARILTHISSVRRVCEPMTLHNVGILQYSNSNNYEHPWKLHERREKISIDLLDEIVCNPTHSLHSLLPQMEEL